MVSIMETTPDPRQQLAEARRAAAAPYVDYPPTPSWFPVTVGAWSAGLVAALTVLEQHPVLKSVLVLGLVLAEAAFIGWYRTYRGTSPSLRQVPREIGREMTRFAVGFVVVVLAVLGAAVLLPPVVPVALAFVLVTAGVSVYERRYARAAAATRARLG
jgi:hypothetical protein